MNKPRREYVFNTVQSSQSSDYVPAPTRDPERRALFVGGAPGTVIAWQQKIGIIAAEKTLSGLEVNEDKDHVHDAADLFAVTAMGTAYHTFAQHSSDEVMFRRIKLPRMFDPELDYHIEQGELVEKALNGLAHAAELAMTIEQMIRASRSRELVAKKNLALGRLLATTGVTLAVIKDGVANLRMDEVGMQEAAMQAAAASYEKSIDLTKQLGVRPTFAQFADNRSPLMQYLNIDEASVAQPVYEALVSEITVAEEQSFRD